MVCLRTRAFKMGLAAVIAAAVWGCVTTPVQEQPKQELVWPSPPDEPRFYFEQTIRSSADVVGQSSRDLLKAFATGETAGGEAMAKPWGVAAHAGKVYVGDTVAGRVHVFDTVKRAYGAIGAGGPGALGKPLDIATDNAGRVYVVDSSSKAVAVYEDDAFVRWIGSREVFSRPSGVAVTDDGSRIYVLDTGGVDSPNHRIVVFDAQGTQLSTIGTRGPGEGQFNLPLSITMAPNGLLYVLDSGNFRVQVFDQEGKFIRAFGSPGKFPGQFARPKGIASDRDGNIYVTDVWFGNIQIFNSEGQILMAMGQRADSAEGGSYLLIAGIAVDQADGRVYVVDQFHQKLDVFRPAWQQPRQMAGSAQ